VAVLARVCSVITAQDFDVLLVAGGVVLSAVPVVIWAVIGSTLPDVPLPLSGSLLGRKVAWLGRGLWAAVIFAIGATVGGLVGVDFARAGVRLVGFTGYLFRFVGIPSGWSSPSGRCCCSPGGPGVSTSPTPAASPCSSYLPRQSPGMTHTTRIVPRTRRDSLSGKVSGVCGRGGWRWGWAGRAA
jgi:hypothetical protein